MNKNRLPIPKDALKFLPQLAAKIGLNESIILQQVHFCLGKSKIHVIDGRRWISNTYSDWSNLFPFWSIITIKRAILNLERQDLLVSTTRNKKKRDQTKWYTLNYDKVSEITSRRIK